MSLRKQLLNLLFPPRCPFCNQPLHDAETGPLPGLPAGPLLDPRGPGRGPGQNFVRCACAGWYRGGLRDSLRRFKFSGQKGMPPPMAPSWPRRCRPTSPAATTCSPGCPSPRRTEGAGGMTRPSCWPRPLPGLGHRGRLPAGQDRAQRPSVLPHPGQPAAVQRGGVYTVPSRRRWPAGGCW